VHARHDADVVLAAVAPGTSQKWPQCFLKRRRFATKWYITLCVQPIVRNRVGKLEFTTNCQKSRWKVRNYENKKPTFLKEAKHLKS